MFGQNQLRGREQESNSGNYQVHETFLTIQGEGPFSGVPAVFVRLSGCNLRCWFCDTPWDDNAPYIKTEQLMERIRFHANKAEGETRPWLVVLTGGEPMRHDLKPLVRALNAEGFTTQIETAGTIFDEELSEMPRVVFVVSPKTGKVQPEFGQVGVYWKYVVRADAIAPDGFPTGGTQRMLNGEIGGHHILARPENPIRVYFTPCDVQDDAANLANLKAAARCAEQTGGIVQVQLHKIIGLP